MIRLLFGDTGTGKSTHIFDLIKADYHNGIHSYLIVPEQETVLRERQIASLLPSRAQLFCEATNFTRLANSVFRACGGLKTNYISKSGKNLIINEYTDNLRMIVYPAWSGTVENKLTMSAEVQKIRNCTREGDTLTFECWEDTPTIDIELIVEVHV